MNPPSAPVRYTSNGPVRGACGHKHKDLESAVECWANDETICRRRGGHTDRKLLVIEGGAKRELSPAEVELVRSYLPRFGL